MATLNDDGWELGSAEEEHANHPETFDIPSKAERSDLKPGQMVKLLFRMLDDADGNAIIQVERMWVSIVEGGEGAYIGRLESLPITSDVLKPLDRIEFFSEHVAAIFVRKGDPVHPHDGQGEGKAT